VRDDPSAVQRVIEADGTIAGTIGCFRIDDQTEVTYRIDRRSGAEVSPVPRSRASSPRPLNAPLFARAATDDAASLRVLERPGSDVSASIATSPAAAERRSRRRSCVSTEQPRLRHLRRRDRFVGSNQRDRPRNSQLRHASSMDPSSRERDGRTTRRSHLGPRRCR
jgi:hypothetical protein